MHLSDFDFELPNNLIALRPAVPRSSSRMLVATNSTIKDSQFMDLTKFLRKGDRLVINNTKVIPARLKGQRIRQSDNGKTLANIGVNLLSIDENGYWLALAKPSRRVNIGEVISNPCKRTNDSFGDFDRGANCIAEWITCDINILK